MSPVAATDKSGTVWIAWQSWNATDFEICAQPLGKKAARQRKNRVGANEWNPAIAADSKGKVFVAFDTYSAGNYDVYLWVLDEDATPSDPIPIATSPRFDARTSVTVDRQDRVWVAYEDADPNWGKDFGSRWKGKSGVPFYVRRGIAVRCFDNGRLMQAPPVQSQQVDTDMLVGKGAEGNDLRLSFPRLSTDAAGRVWLAFRRHAAANGAGERWMSFATAFDGRKWLPEIPLPNSENLMDNRPGLAAMRSGGLLAVYSTDGRTAGTNTAGENDLHAAILTADGDTTPPELASVQAAGDGNAAEPVHPNESQDVRRIREYRIEVGGKTYQFLRGEFHRHTEISAHRDQDGPFEELWRYGLDVARMDWLGPGDHLMGDEFTLRAPPQLEITAIGTAPISRVAIVRGVGNEVPTYVYNSTPNAAAISPRFNFKWTDSNPVPGQTSYYYVRIEQSDGKLAWASPMWIKYEGK